MDYPLEFLGRCSTCLDNAYLNAKPCTRGYGNGQPLSDSECAVRRAQKEYDAERAQEEEATTTQSNPTATVETMTALDLWTGIIDLLTDEETEGAADEDILALIETHSTAIAARARNAGLEAGARALDERAAAFQIDAKRFRDGVDVAHDIDLAVAYSRVASAYAAAANVLRALITPPAAQGSAEKGEGT